MVKSYLNFETDMEDNPAPIRVVTYNVKGVLNPFKRTNILNKKDKAGIVYLQETHLKEPEHAKLKRHGFGQVFSSSFPSGRQRGVAMLISTKSVFEKVSEFKDKEGRYNMVIGKLDGIEVTLLNVNRCSTSFRTPLPMWGHDLHGVGPR